MMMDQKESHDATSVPNYFPTGSYKKTLFNFSVLKDNLKNTTLLSRIYGITCSVNYVETLCPLVLFHIGMDVDSYIF